MSDAAKRFYTSASAVSVEGGYAVHLDARNLRTPGGKVFVVPQQKLAHAIAVEWGAQLEHIVPASMPLTQFAFAALDHTPSRREELIAYVATYGETDLLCHRAAAPAPLVARQEQVWTPLRDWAHATLGADLPVVTGILAADVPAGELAKLRDAATALDDFALTGLSQATGLSGSIIIAFALQRGAITAEAAFEAAALDDLWSLEHWGDDAEARARLESQQAEFDALARFFASLA